MQAVDDRVAKYEEELDREVEEIIGDRRPMTASNDGLIEEHYIRNDNSDEETSASSEYNDSSVLIDRNLIQSVTNNHEVQSESEQNENSTEEIIGENQNICEFDEGIFEQLDRREWRSAEQEQRKTSQVEKYQDKTTSETTSYSKSLWDELLGDNFEEEERNREILEQSEASISNESLQRQTGQQAPLQQWGNKIETIAERNERIAHKMKRLKQTTLGFADEFDQGGKCEPRKIAQKKTDRECLRQWNFDEIPKEHEDNISRFCLNNIQSFGTDVTYIKAHQIAQMMGEYNINFLGGPESRVNPRCRETAEIEAIVQQYLPESQVYHTNSKIIRTKQSRHQYGGVSTFICPRLSKKFNGIIHDKHGRWSTTKLLTAGNNLEVVVGYNTGAKPKDGKKNAWYDREQLLLAKGITTPPEIQFIRDLEEQLRQSIINNKFVIFMADANESIDDRNPAMYRMLKGLGLINLLEARAEGKLPTTCSSGDDAIDHVWVTSNLLARIVRVGLAPLNLIVKSDHRAIILDLLTEGLFLNPLVTVTPFEKRRLKSSVPKRVKQYCEYVERQHKKEKVADRLTTAETKADLGHNEDACELANSIYNQLIGIGLAGEKNLTALHSNKFSAKFQNALQISQKTKNQLNHLKKVCKNAPTAVNTAFVKEAARKYKSSMAKLRQMRITSAEIRESFLEELAEALFKAGKFKSKEIALKVLKHIEKQKREARMKRFVHGSKFSNTLSYILIPKKCNYAEELQPFYKDVLVMWNRLEVDSGKDIKEWEPIADRDEMEEMLLGFQCLHFTQAQDTPLASEEWENILMNEDTYKTVEQKHEAELDKLDPPTRAFVKELYTKQEAVVGSIRDFTIQDLETYIKEKDEKTATSPCGHHLGHYKSLLGTEAFENFYRVIKLAVRLNFIMEKDRVTLTVLAEKDTGSPKIHRLRTLHIIEIAVQFIANFYWSRQFLRYCELQPNHLTDNQYGGRRGRIAHTAVVIQQMIFDIARKDNIPMVTHFADARANFDRNICYIVYRALIARGFPENIGRYYMKFLMCQIYYVKTVFGATKTGYTRKDDNRLFGCGQGVAWSAPNQQIITSVTENVAAVLGAKFELMSFDKSRSTTKGSKFFIDDRGTNTMLQVGQNLCDLLNIAQANEVLQGKLLNAAGGALAPKKCKIWVLVRNENSLTLRYKTEKAFPGTIKLRSTGGAEAKALTRMAPNKSLPYLGCMVNPMMHPKDQIAVFRETIDQWSGEIGRGNLKTDLVVQSYEGRLVKKLEWPLMSSHLSYKQCDILMGKVRKLLLKERRIHSKMNKVITHGSSELCGINLFHLYDAQGQTKLNLIRRHAAEVVVEDEFYNVFLISLGKHMLWLGHFRNFLNEDYHTWKDILAQKSWIGSVWEYLTFRKLRIDIIRIPTYTLPRENDRYIMDLTHDLGYSGKDQQRINRVRHQLQLLSLADIVLEDGMKIHPDIKRGKTHNRHSMFDWPRKEKIQRSWRTTFIKFMKDVEKFLRDENNDNKLGRWKSKSHQKKTFYRVHEHAISDGTHVYEEVFNPKGISFGTHRKTRLITDLELHSDNFIDVQDLGMDRVVPLDDIQAQWIAIETMVSEYESLPKWKRQLWGMIPLTKNHIQQIIKGCQKPYIQSSDGGNPPDVEYGTYSYILANKKGEAFYKNFNCLGWCDDQESSERVEAAGHLAATSLVNWVEKSVAKHGIVFTQSREFSLDNETISKLSKETEFEKKAYKQPNFDIKLQLVKELKANINNPDNLSWVESHADRRKNHLEWTVQEALNVQADHLCHVAHREAIRLNYVPSTISILFPAQGVSIRNKRRRFIKEKPFTLHKDQVYCELKEHIQREEGITDAAFDQIAWKSLGGLYKSSNIYGKIRIVKTVHNKRNTFAAQQKMKQHENGLCALCGKHTETQQHLHDCDNEMFVDKRDAALRDMKGELTKAHTPDTLIKYMCMIIKDPYNMRQYTQIFDEFDAGLRAVAMKAVKSQDFIGWEQFRKGIISKYWRDIMVVTLKRQEQKYRVETWERRIIQLILKYNDFVWNTRCTMLQPSEFTYLEQLRHNADQLLFFLKKHPHFVGFYKNLIRHRNGYFATQNKYTILDWNASIKNAVKHTKTFQNRKQPRLTKFFNYKTVPAGKMKKFTNAYESGLAQIKQWLKVVSIRTDLDYEINFASTLDVDPEPEPD